MSKQLKIVLISLGVIILLGGIGLFYYFKIYVPKTIKDYVSKVKVKVEEVSKETENVLKEDDSKDSSNSDKDAIKEEMKKYLEDLAKLEKLVNEAKVITKINSKVTKSLDDKLEIYYTEILKETKDRKAITNDMEKFIDVFMEMTEYLQKLQSEQVVFDFGSEEGLNKVIAILNKTGDEIKNIGNKLNDLRLESSKIKDMNKGLGQALIDYGKKYSEMSALCQRLLDAAKSNDKVSIEQIAKEIETVGKDLDQAKNNLDKQIENIPDLDKEMNNNFEAIEKKGEEVKVLIQELEIKYGK